MMRPGVRLPLTILILFVGVQAANRILLQQTARLQARSEEATSKRSTPSAEGLLQRSYHEDDVRAVHTLVLAEKYDPDNTRILFRIGFLFHKMNRRDEAVAYYQKVLQYDSCHGRALNNLAGISHDRGQTDSAKEYYRRSIECDGDFYLPYFNLANILEKDGSEQNALALYEKAIELNPGHAGSLHNAGLLYFRKAKRSQDSSLRTEALQRAESLLQRSVGSAPRDSLNRLNLAIVQMALKKYESARKQLQEASRFAGNNTRRQNAIREQIKRLERLSNQ